MPTTLLLHQLNPKSRQDSYPLSRYHSSLPSLRSKLVFPDTPLASVLRRPVPTYAHPLRELTVLDCMRARLTVPTKHSNHDRNHPDQEEGRPGVDLLVEVEEEHRAQQHRVTSHRSQIQSQSQRHRASFHLLLCIRTIRTSGRITFCLRRRQRLARP